jgi:hypothetical protein
MAALPPKVDLRQKCPVLYDQGHLGSYTANAIGGAMEFDLLKQKQKESDFVPPRLFIYYNERVIEGIVYFIFLITACSASSFIHLIL